MLGVLSRAIPALVGAVVERYRRQTETYPNLLPAVARSTAHTFTLTTIVAGAWEGADITCAVRSAAPGAPSCRASWRGQQASGTAAAAATERARVAGRTRFASVQSAAGAHCPVQPVATCSSAQAHAQSTTNPDDPLVQSMRRDGTLLPLAWCANGSRVPADIADAPYDPLWGPLVSTDTAAEAVEAMRQQAAAAAQLEASQVRCALPLRVLTSLDPLLR